MPSEPPKPVSGDEQAKSVREERRIVKRAKRGDRQALEQLVRRHWHSAYVLAFGVLGDEGLAEDAAQEGLLAAIRSLDAFKPDRPLAPWLHRIIVNRAIDVQRSSRSRRELPLVGERTLETGLSNHSVPDSSAALTRALGELEARERAAVVLRYVLGHSAREVGEILGFGEGTARTIFHRSLKKLRESLDQETSEVSVENE